MTHDVGREVAFLSLNAFCFQFMRPGLTCYAQVCGFLGYVKGRGVCGDVLVQISCGWTRPLRVTYGENSELM